MKRLGLGICVWLASLSCTGKYVREVSKELHVEPTLQRVERGRYLVENVAACGACHDGRASKRLLDAATPGLELAGGLFMRDGDFSIYSPNITPDNETGIGRWSDDELIRGIRDGVKPDGSFMFPIMPFMAYRHLSDEDVKSIVVFLRTRTPVRTPHPKEQNEIPFFVSRALGMGVAMHEPAVTVPEPERRDPVKYGEYLAQAAHCTVCHSLGSTGPRDRDDRWMAGSDAPMEPEGVGKVWASNLTPSRKGGLGNAPREQVRATLVSGLRLDGKPMAPPMSLLTPHIALMNPEDLDALVAYLASLPPVDGKVPARELTSQFQKLLGE